jgi:5-methylcytosine-specific restriction protein A
MSARAPKFCSNATCGELVPAGVRYCPTHDTGRWPTGKNIPKSRSADAKWRKTRKLVLKRDNHRCQIRYVGQCIGVATEVDHITPVAEGGTDSPSNLQASCRPCHLAKSSDEGHTAAGHKTPGRIRFIPNEIRNEIGGWT